MICQGCEGLGYLECSECGGDGEYTVIEPCDDGTDDEQTVHCEECAGTGRLACDECGASAEVAHA